MHEMLLLSILVGVFLNVAWKWTKTLMVIILLELATTSVMASFFLVSSGYSFLAILMFLFFVGEALILLSALYSALRSSGATYSSLVLS